MHQGAWEVEYTDEWGAWFVDLDPRMQDSVAVVVGLLERLGPGLGFPYSSRINRSRHRVMRELRIQHRMVPLADRLYDEHLEQLRNEGLI